MIRIKLKDTSFPIRRRIEVNYDIALAEFHKIIQIVMGWYDCHLHQFYVNETIYTSK